MDDRTLLERAAKAAGYWSHRYNCPDKVPMNWDPLINDGDALRLAVKLDLRHGLDDRFIDLGACIYCTYQTGPASCNSIMQNIAEAGGEEAATRRAIVRAAAELGLEGEGK